MALAHLLGFAAVVCLGVFSGSAVGWYWWQPPPNPGDSWGRTATTDGCQEVYNNYISCEDYIAGADQYPRPECCSGLVYLNQIARNQENGAAGICQCIEAIAARGGHPPYSESQIENLYYSCNVHLSFPISEHMDCSRV